ncbi:MAG TPA: HAMP domain-containing sensor histidine kinase, partial [Vicinamibacterales bacterium]
PMAIARLVAADLGAALEADPSIDPDAWLRDTFGRLPHDVFVVFPDGRVATNRRFQPPEPLVRAASRSLQLQDDAGPGRRALRGRLRFPVVRVDDEIVAAVGVVRAGGPLEAALRTYGPALLGAGGLLLVVGILGIVFFVLAPARRRLRSLERAAAALGRGDVSARAPEAGGDEIADLARAFNRMAAELEARLRDLAEADRVRRQLLADVSHELMTPLTAMRGYLETLAMPELASDPAARERYLRIVIEETLRLEAIVGDLLDLARLEGGGSPLELRTVPLKPLFSRLLERYEMATAARGISIETAIEPGAEQVQGDERRLEQALSNLVANAVRHTPDGGTVHVSAACDNGFIRLRVQDSGPGISPEHLPLIFDRFYKADAARAAGDSGSGLGLSIVKAIVERHGGRVTASNAPEGGARFDIELPRSL